MPAGPGGLGWVLLVAATPPEGAKQLLLEELSPPSWAEVHLSVVFLPAGQPPRLQGPGGETQQAEAGGWVALPPLQ